MFFKWLKQHLRIKAFFDTSENAVKTQIWTAVSLYVLAAIIKKRLKLTLELYTILQILSLTFFEKVSLYQLVTQNHNKTDHRDILSIRLIPGTLMAYNMSYILPTTNILTVDFISIRDFRTQPDKIWEKLARAHQMVVTRNGKPFAILTATSPTDLETDLQNLRRSRFGRALAGIRTEAQKKGLDKLSLDQINDIIRDAREACRNEGGS